MNTPAGLTEQSDVTGSRYAECGVVIVGSGAGGATMAAELADAGIDVVLIEEGGYHPTESFTAEGGRALRALYRDGGGGIAVGRPPVLFAEGRCVGGSTVVNGGMSWRTPPQVLHRWATEEGVTGISETEMDPYFARVESRISVALQDPETVGRDSALLKKGADAKGWRIVPNLRNQLHCAGTNNCTNGCPTGAKRSMLVTSVPRALRRGARLFADCRVDRVTRQARRSPGCRAISSGREASPGRGSPSAPGSWSWPAARSRPRRCSPGRASGPRPGSSAATSTCTRTRWWSRSSTKTSPDGTASTRPSRSASSSTTAS